MKIVRVGGHFWASHNDLTGLVLPDSTREVGYYAFYGDRGLGSVDLSNTQITNIAARAFQDNYGCTNFFLPKTLQKVGGCAFAWGHSKRVFHFRGDVPEVTLTTSDIVLCRQRQTAAGLLRRFETVSGVAHGLCHDALYGPEPLSARGAELDSGPRPLRDRARLQGAVRQFDARPSL